MTAKFPKRSDDGSFCIDLHFEADTPIDATEVECWLTEWSSTNQEWLREWRSMADREVVKTDVMRLTDAFVREPWVSSSGEKSISVRLHGGPLAPFWKDWMAKLVQDMVRNFTTLKFRGASDAEGPK